MMSTSNYLSSRRSSTMETKVAKPISISSMLGRFVRKCRLEYIKLEFDEAGLLWSLFRVSRGPSQQKEDLSPPEDLDGSLELHIPEYLDGVPIGGSIETSMLISIECYSQDDIEKQCRVEVEQFQSNPSSTSH